MKLFFIRWWQRLMRLLRIGPRALQAPAGPSSWDAITFDEYGIGQVDVRLLRRNDLLTVSTKNSVYFIRIDDPAQRAVIVSGPPGHKVFGEPRHVRVAGALIHDHGSMLAIAKIARGHRIEFSLDGPSVIKTSPIQGVVLNGAVVVDHSWSLELHGVSDEATLLKPDRLH